jgi:hypothetical protein
MDEDIRKILELMEVSFRDFEEAMREKPNLVRKSFGEVYRFQEKDIYQAIIQKLAHAQSTLRAALVLLEHGFVHEQAALQRVLDEANEDILFLVYAVTNDSITELHEKFLTVFWEEEFNDSGDPLTSEQKRPMVSRKKIRAYIAKIEGVELYLSRGVELARSINKAYSGFVHGASLTLWINMEGTRQGFTSRECLAHLASKSMRATYEIICIGHLYRTSSSQKR